MAVVSCQNHPEITLGITYYPSSIRTITMDAATPTCFAYSFVVPSSPFGSGNLGVLNFRWNCTTATGSPKVTAYLVADVNGVPDVIANALATATETGVISAGFVTCTFPSPYTITAGTQYWIALKCTSGTSAVITTFDGSAIVTGLPPAVGGGTFTGTWRALGASGSGAAWAGTARNEVVGVRVGLTNGTDTAYFGWPMSAQTGKSAAADKVYGTIETGACYTVPSNATLSVKSVIMTLRKALAPGNLSLKLYTGDSTTVTATSNAIVAANVITATAQMYTFDFATAVTLTGGTKYRFVIAAASGDTSNYYYVYTDTMDSDSVVGGTVDLIPGLCHFCNLTSGSWTDTATTDVPIFGLVLNTAGAFVSSGGSARSGGNRGFWRGMGKI
jgi:hypothetical protein